MDDVWMIALIAAFFGASFGAVNICSRILRSNEQVHPDEQGELV
jgi:hypothetical protein